MSLEVKDLQVSYGGIEALRGVSIRAERGKIVAVLGRNGAGKTTLLRAISGLAASSAGSIEWDGIQLHGRSPSDISRRGVVQVPEGRRILAELTVRENLILGGYGLKRGREDRIDRVLEIFPILKERLHLSGASLSGGQQQMLALGRGLVRSPSLLLIDELSLGLAPIVVGELARRLEVFRQEGIGILLVEQEYPLALKIADYVYVLQKGKVRWEGEPEGALEILRSSYLAADVNV